MTDFELQWVAFSAERGFVCVGDDDCVRRNSFGVEILIWENGVVFRFPHPIQGATEPLLMEWRDHMPVALLLAIFEACQ